jgi:hypothetical protein
MKHVTDTTQDAHTQMLDGCACEKKRTKERRREGVSYNAATMHHHVNSVCNARAQKQRGGRESKARERYSLRRVYVKLGVGVDI